MVSTTDSAACRAPTASRCEWTSDGETEKSSDTGAPRRSYGRNAQAGMLVSMRQRAPYILCINVGSSSFKYASFDSGNLSQRVSSGHLERIGISSGLTFEEASGKLLAELSQHVDPSAIGAIAHR